ncbi:hypothetical protein [Nonomuraea candida]|uniref:hypothetical protein n=1 Tax=Nonomuraea candida TaxID=359159 RepID=UPI0005BAD38C|nr:hypothetical protein [Nonomuraea candida]
MTRRADDDPDDEFFAPVLRDDEPSTGERQGAGKVSDTGVPGVRGAGHGDWAQAPPPRNKLSLRLLAAALALLAGVVLAVLAVLAGQRWLAVPPAVVALAAAVYLVAFGARRSRSGGGPPTFG